MGVYVFEPEVLSYVRGRGYLDFPDLVKILLNDHRLVNYYPFDGYWLDIGRHDDYGRAAEEFAAMKQTLGLD